MFSSAVSPVQLQIDEKTYKVGVEHAVIAQEWQKLMHINIILHSEGIKPVALTMPSQDTCLADNQSDISKQKIPLILLEGFRRPMNEFR